jgi:hypothetical protein
LAGAAAAYICTTRAEGYYQIRTRRYWHSRSGIEAGPDETVNRSESGQQTAPAIAINAQSHIIAWRDDMEENGKGEILAAGCLNRVGCEREERSWGNRQALLESIAGSCPAATVWPKCQALDRNTLPDLNLVRPTPESIPPEPE